MSNDNLTLTLTFDVELDVGGLEHFQKLPLDRQVSVIQHLIMCGDAVFSPTYNDEIEERLEMLKEFAEEE